jgi:hypothetical protein
MLNVDLRGIPPATVLQPVPENWYKVVIRKSNMKPTSKGDGGYLELICEILEGVMQGRVVYWNLNLFNPSQQAVEIAYKTLSAIGHCIGVFSILEQNVPDNHTPMLHNIPFYIWVVVVQGNQGPINNIRACKDINGNDPGKATVQQPPQPSQPNFGEPAPAAPAPAWNTGAPTTGPQGGTSPAAWPGAGAPAAPVAPGGQPWQPGTNTAPQAAPAPAGPSWNANPATGAPSPFPAAGPTSFAAPPAQAAPATWQQQQPQGGAPNPNAPWAR